MVAVILRSWIAAARASGNWGSAKQGTESQGAELNEG
jgi:hypothetical protein